MRFILDELSYNPLDILSDTKARLSDVYHLRQTDVQPFGYTIPIVYNPRRADI